MSCKHFSKFVAAVLLLAGPAFAADVKFVGESGVEWRDGGFDWSKDGGDPDTAQNVFGRTNGTETAQGDFNILIDGGNVVNYNSGASKSDFRTSPQTKMTITGGAVWQQVVDETWSSNAWTRFNAGELNLDNGSFLRTGKPTAEFSPIDTDKAIGGWFVIGGLTGAADGQTSTINITNGGVLKNDGQLLFGYPADNVAGARKNLTVNMNINNGTVDLTGGYIHETISEGVGFSEGDLLFVDNFDGTDVQRPNFSINFTGPGTIVTDLGIANPNRNADGLNWYDVETKLTWQQVWDKGILKANGKSGKDGLNFSDYFTTTGTFDGENYTLTSKVTAGNPIDLNGDGAVDAADAGIMFGDWGGPGSTSPADFNDDGFVDAADAGTMFEAWTGDPATPGAKAATAEYNPETGELKISSAGAVNVFVQSASNAITPISPAPAVPVGLLTNNTGRVGITNLGPIEVTNFSFGNIGKGLAMSDLKLVYTTALGTKGIEVPAGSSDAFKYIPEPASFGLIGLGLAGLLAARRRS